MELLKHIDGDSELRIKDEEISEDIEEQVDEAIAASSSNWYKKAINENIQISSIIP